MSKQYKVVNGYSFGEETPIELCEKLSTIGKKSRIRLFYGDTTTGLDWMEEYDTIGTIGRSCGEIKIPLLIKRKDSLGGCSILDDCIVKLLIDGITVYKHPSYHQKELTMDISSDEKYPFEVKTIYNGETKLLARFEKESQAIRYMAFIKSERNSK